jgi:uncharacterized membrane protein
MFMENRLTTMIDKPYRSVVKTFSWRITGTIDTIIVSFIISGKLKVAFTIGFIELFTKISLYYIHERIWNKLKFGRLSIKDEDYQI